MSNAHAGDGEYYILLKKAEGDASTDNQPLTRDQHYLGIDAVRWYVNEQGNFLTDKTASGTVEIGIGAEKYNVGLRKYELEKHNRTAPSWDEPILPNRRYVAGDISITCFINIIKHDTLLASLLKSMGEASLAVVAGAVSSGIAPAAAGVAGVATTALTAAAGTLTGGIQDILKVRARRDPS